MNDGSGDDAPRNDGSRNDAILGIAPSATGSSTEAGDAPANARASEARSEEGSEAQVRYSASPGLAGWLGSQRIAIAFTSYQSGKLYLIGANPRGGLMVHERFYQKAMGLCVPDPGTIWLASAYHIVRFRDALGEGQFANGLHDRLYVPRTIHTTGAVDAHDVGQLTNGRPVFVATAFNCLATLHDDHSFAEYWRPPFIDALIGEDRCHLNGMAMRNGAPAFVTACSRSNTVDGWRDRRASGGVVIDVADGRVAASGLSMPHSPRLHEGTLYVLNSGTGELGRVNLDAPDVEAFEPIAFCPGFVRGLGFHGGHAVVGLSKPRYERFEGLALDERLREADSEPWCGVQAIELATGRVAHWFRIDGAIAELYDVTVIPDTLCPMAVPLSGDETAGFVSLPD